MGFGRSRFRFAGPAGEYTDLRQVAGKRVATSYAGIVRAFLEERGIDARLAERGWWRALSRGRPNRP